MDVCQEFTKWWKYRNLIEQSHATLCFVDNYMTWNLSVQDELG